MGISVQTLKNGLFCGHISTEVRDISAGDVPVEGGAAAVVDPEAVAKVADVVSRVQATA